MEAQEDRRRARNPLGASSHSHLGRRIGRGLAASVAVRWRSTIFKLQARPQMQMSIARNGMGQWSGARASATPVGRPGQQASPRCTRRHWHDARYPNWGRADVHRVHVRDVERQQSCTQLVSVVDPSYTHKKSRPAVFMTAVCSIVTAPLAPILHDGSPTRLQ